jgi:protein FAM32A
LIPCKSESDHFDAISSLTVINKNRKKKKKSSSKGLEDKVAAYVSEELVEQSSSNDGGLASESTTTVLPPVRAKTAAELKFEEAQRKRLDSKAKELASKSHKERVAEFNAYLEKLSEHHDIPKVGPG